MNTNCDLYNIYTKIPTHNINILKNNIIDMLQTHTTYYQSDIN